MQQDRRMTYYFALEFVLAVGLLWKLHSIAKVYLDVFQLFKLWFLKPVYVRFDWNVKDSSWEKNWQSQHISWSRLSLVLVEADQGIKKWKGINKLVSWITLNGTLNDSSLICFIFRQKYIHTGLRNIRWSTQTLTLVKRMWQFMITILSGSSTLQIPG